MTEQDKWRHVRAVLAARTPDSILVVNRYGMGINPHATGKAVTVLMRKHDDPNREQVDADLDALSVLWNVADELLADAEALAGERRRVSALEDSLRQISKAIKEESDPLETISMIVSYMLTPADDAPGQRAKERTGGMALPSSPTSEYVERFAALMERKLAENRHKGDRDGWLKDSPNALLRRLHEEVAELERAVTIGASPAEIAGEAADIGNFAMFVADRCGGLSSDAPGRGTEGSDHGH